MKYTNLSHNAAREVKQNLLNQCLGVEWIKTAFYLAWESYKTDGWDYDGATFVAEHDNDFWEVAAFIHDWLNCIGYVGKQPDLYFIKIMVVLGYGENKIFERAKWMQYTFVNVWRHKLKGTFKANALPNILRYGA